MTVFEGTKCPECGKGTVFPYSKMIEIDGKMCRPMSVKCNSCNWELSDEEVIKNWKEWIKKCEKLNK